MPTTHPEIQLDHFIARYTPDIAALAQGVLSRMRDRLPTAHQLVYDNYNACAIGFSPTERASDVIFSIALFPQRVDLFFMQAAKSDLKDPDGLLQGSGKLVRFIPLDSPRMVDSAPVERLMEQALAAAKVPLAVSGTGRLIIKSISAKQRPRRPPPLK